MSEKYSVKVAFRREDDGGILAIFPEEWTNRGKGEVTCYAHMGQHSSTSLEYAKALDVPTVDETVELRDELRRVGYELIDVTL